MASRLSTSDVSHVTVRGVGSYIKRFPARSEVSMRNLTRSTVRYLFTRHGGRYSQASDSFTVSLLRDKMIQWLSPPDPFINHNKLITAVQLSGCPREVFSTEIYWFIPMDTWKTCVTLGLCRATILELPSFIAGSGKSVLCALVRSSSTLYLCETDVINLVPRCQSLAQCCVRLC
jgi:hypothetical protein